MGFELAHFNIARLLQPLDHPQIADFVQNLDPINALAEQSPGFVWRLKTESGNATDAVHPWSGDPLTIVNLSVWQTPELLRDFVYRTQHLDFYKRRGDWFERPSQAHYVLWWVPAGHLPGLEEARDRLELYRAHGATPEAFGFSETHPAPRLSEDSG